VAARPGVHRARVDERDAWTASGIGLAVGSNAITLTAFDGGGQSANKTVYVTRVQSTTGSPTAPVSPRNGVSRVTWQTAAGASGQASGTLQLAATGIPLLTGTNAITLRAYDTAGNAAWASLTVVKR
jgi:uncharacterized protein YjdB